jgi:Concanavalin A-like lectin/glucanases superfamily
MKHLVQFLLLFFVCNIGLQAQTPVASYTFSGHAKDGSTYSNHGSVNGASLVADRFGFANSAFSFDGKQGAVTAPNAVHLQSGSTTISFWVNVRTLPAQGEAYMLSHGGWQERWKISLPAHGKPVFTTHAASCCNDMDSGGGNELKVNEWRHVVMTHDGTADKMYMNGLLVNEKAYAGALNATTHPFGIGYDPIDKANYFDGLLDDVMLFDEALSAAQIANLYAAQSVAPVTPAGLVAAYYFDKFGTDGSDYGNNAKVNSATYTTDRFGYGNSAVLMDGVASEVTAANAANVNSDFTTVSLWVKVNNLPANGEVFILSNGGWQERLKISLPSHGKPVFTTNYSGGISDMDSGDGHDLKPGQWTHLVMVHDGAKNKIFLDGVLVAEKVVVGTLNNTTKPLGIGYNAIDGGNWFDGVMDDVEIYNFALSDKDVADLYTAQSQFPGSVDDLVANYSLNGDGTDETQYGNDAAIDVTATATTNRHGWAANALHGAAVADNSIALQSDFTTISFWVNPTSLPASGEVYLMSNGGWQERWKISLPSHGKPVFTTHATACCSDMDSGDGNALKVGEWTHVAMVHDGTNDQIFVNGILANQKATAGALNKTKFPLGIGFDPIDNSGFFDGSMDDVMIFNKALSAAEIAALYDIQKTEPSVGSELVADYTFDNTRNDNSAYKNNAYGNAVSTKDRFGKANRAVVFDGKSTFVEAANSPQMASDFTSISFWAKVNALSWWLAGKMEDFSSVTWQAGIHYTCYFMLQ